jgi:hypothetical protein
MSTQLRELRAVSLNTFQVGRSGRGPLSIGKLFKWGKAKAGNQSVPDIKPEWRPDPPEQSQRIISFRIQADLDRRISREVKLRSITRSDFIRNALDPSTGRTGTIESRACCDPLGLVLPLTFDCWSDGVCRERRTFSCKKSLLTPAGTLRRQLNRNAIQKTGEIYEKR